jgi:hypothetical protein
MLHQNFFDTVCLTVLAHLAFAPMGFSDNSKRITIPDHVRRYYLEVPRLVSIPAYDDPLAVSYPKAEIEPVDVRNFAWRTEDDRVYAALWGHGPKTDTLVVSMIEINPHWLK